jgi:two-component system, NarL family, sensor histidine kinase DesK
VGESPAQAALFVVYWTVGLVTGAVALYGAARLVRVLDELEATRAELAELAIGRERLRISRDLHDLLGHSLSAISLKGDLARRLLHSDVHAARAEIEGLTAVARNALRDVRAITRDKHTVSLRTETDGAAALLGAAGIDARIDLDVPELARPTEEVLAWAVREGITNVLRHSQATTCSVTAARRGGMVRLEIVNDGARPSAGEGNGLAGLAGRARALSGSASGLRLRGGRFRLLVELPEEAA